MNPPNPNWKTKGGPWIMNPVRHVFPEGGSQIVIVVDVDRTKGTAIVVGPRGLGGCLDDRHVRHPVRLEWLQWPIGKLPKWPIGKLPTGSHVR